MKKFLTITFAFMLVLALSGCGSGSSSNEKYGDSEYLGTWELTGYQVEDRTIPVDEHGESSLTLNANGTYKEVSEASIEDEDGNTTWEEVTSTGTWEEKPDGFVTTGDVLTLEYKVKGDKAKAEYQSTTLIRKRK